MKKIVFIALAAASCGNPAAERYATMDSTSQETVASIDTALAPTDTSYAYDETQDYADYYVVIADTGMNYYPLQRKMYDISRQLALAVDTMGRYYNKEKDLIALPDDDEDEIYAGEYYPRRSPSDYLSLEYLDYFRENAETKTIALVAGIFENERSADSAVTILKQAEKHTFRMKAKVYVGCMH